MPSCERLDPLTDLREREYAYLAGDDFPTCWPGAASSWPRRDAASARIRCGAKAVACRSANILRRPFRCLAALPTWLSGRDVSRGQGGRHDTPGTPADRLSCSTGLRRWKTRRAIPRRCARSTMGLSARRTRFIRWCRPCWCRTRRSSAPTRASASSKHELGIEPEQPRSRAASSTACATRCSAARAARLGAERSGRARRASTGGRRYGGPGGAPQRPDMRRQPQQPAPAGGSFLGTAAATAAGVIGGALLMNSLRGMFGGQQAGLAGGKRGASIRAAGRHALGAGAAAAILPARPASTTSAAAAAAHRRRDDTAARSAKACSTRRRTTPIGR